MNLLKETYREFSEDRCLQMAAALAFYAMLSLVPLLLLIVTAASLVMGRQAQQAFTQQASTLVGPQGAEELQELLDRGRRQQPSMSQSQALERQTPPGQGPNTRAETSESQASGWTVSSILENLVSILVLILSATGLVVQLQSSLNQVWDVEADRERSGITGFLTKRLWSLALILIVAVLLLASVAMTTAIGVVGQWLSSMVGVGQAGGYAISEGTTFLLVTVLFAAMFKVLPDAKVPWKVTWMGAVVTGFLFTIGKFLIGLYLGSKDMSSAYGQAGSLVLVLVWTYYSAIIFFFGAELTQVLAHQQGERDRAG